MPFLVTAHSTKPGMEDFYEGFLQNRKLAFVRALPGVKRYDVYRMDHRADDPKANGGAAMKYTIVAIIEVEDMAAAQALRSSKQYQEFVSEYIDLLEDDPAIFAAHAVQQLAAVSKAEFWSAHPDQRQPAENLPPAE